MKKNKFIIILLIFTLLFNLKIVNAQDKNINEGYQDYLEEVNTDFPEVKSSNVILYNLTDDTVLYEKNSNDLISIASLTKIMTVLTTIENVDDLEKEVTITKDAFSDISEYSTAGFNIGDKVTYLDLLYGTLLPSGAEAAQAVALATSNTISDFVALMNEEADKLGMTNTHYSNPIGRDDKDNYSTLNDLITLLKYALNNETFYKIYTTKTYTTTNNIELSSTLKTSAGRYNLDITNILGAKSGYTDDAGLCLSTLAEYDNTKYLLITANAPYAYGYPNHIVDTLNIYNYYFDNYKYQKIITNEQQLYTINIKDGFDKTYTITSSDDVSLYLKNDIDLDKLEYNYQGIDTLTSKIKTNYKLGDIEVVYEGNILYTYPVYLTENIKYKHTKLVITIFLTLIIILVLLKSLKKSIRKKRRRKNAKRHKK
jgi:D-alanyl-D-alanine carboxypeptidase (penicillin-binding protein 5/6)